MKYRIKNIDTGELKGVIFNETVENNIRADAQTFISPRDESNKNKRYVVECLDGNKWVETKITFPE